MDSNFIKLEGQIKNCSLDIAKRIRSVAHESSNEAEFRRQAAQIIHDFADTLGIELRERDEYTVGESGRADTVFNRFVVEYESPGYIKEYNSHGNNRHTIGQVKDYIEGLVKKERLKIHRVAGVAIDGHKIIFVRHFQESWVEEEPVVVSKESIERFLKLLIYLRSGVALIPDNLIKDFGSETLTAQRATRALYQSLDSSHENDLVGALFNQWQTFFGEVTGYEEGSSKFKEKEELRRFARGMGIDPNKANPPRLFFAVHTYYAILIKLIAWLVISRYTIKLGPSFGKLSTLSPEELKKELLKMEHGGIFREFGIRNFLEGDFFGWYLQVWNEPIEQVVRKVIEILNDYDPATLDGIPEQTRDLLKKLYHYLMPKELRHDLGEYYTPDWLAQRLLNMLDGGKFTGDPKKRILDPACGSGTFLVLIIKAIKVYAEKIMIPEAEVLKLILSNVVGVDLNPLAVITARTNFILSLGNLLEYRKGDMDIPIYLADSIVTPSEGEDLFEKDKYRVKTTVGIFEIPLCFGTREKIDKLSNILDEAVESEIDSSSFLSRVEKEIGLDGDKNIKEILNSLYSQMLELHRKGLNGIWARIIKNAFAPLFIGKFDYVVGNPPWVNWESLPEGYRDSTKKYWVKYGLFPHSGIDTILGKGKKDISALMTYVAMDNYLIDKGRLGFVITQAVLKTSGAGQGFRRFQIGDSDFIKALAVDDMSEIKPFEGVSNKTIVIILEKGAKTRFPVTYNYWVRITTGKTLKDDMTLNEIQSITTFRKFFAEPIDSKDITSAWATGRSYSLLAVKKLLGKSPYRAYEGINSGGAGGVYTLEIIDKRPDGLLFITNITKGMKRKVDHIQATIEEKFVYPFLKGSVVKKWKIKNISHILMVQDPKTRTGINEGMLMKDYKKTYAYLFKFKDILLNRPALKRYFKESDAFYTMFNVGEYTLSNYKVVWMRFASRIEAVVIGKTSGKPIIPDNVQSFIPTNDKHEAHYLCAMLNSSLINFGVQCYSQRGGKSFGAPHILNYINILTYDSKNAIMNTLAELSLRAHNVQIKDNATDVQNEIDKYVAKLYGLSERELKDIQKSLSELEGTKNVKSVK